MEQRQLGPTDLSVSALGFGAAALGNHYGPSAVPDAEHIRALQMAIEAGVTVVDTSPFYSQTHSEILVGEALAGGRREQVVLCTKAGRITAKQFDFSASAMLASLDESLKRLRTDYVDVWYAHDIEFAPDLDRVFSETAEALHQAKRTGKCRLVGMTGYPLAVLAQAIALCRLDVVLSYCHMSLATTRLIDELLPVARRHGCAVINGSPLMMGLLSRKGPPFWHPAPAEVKEACARAVQLCVDRRASPELLALQYCLKSEIPCTLVGMATTEEVAANLRAATDPVDEDLLQDVLAELAPIRGVTWPSRITRN